MVKRSLARFSAQIAMFVFIVVLASILHPYMIRFKGNLMWIFTFLVVLGLLLLPSWLFERFQRPLDEPKKPTGVKILRSIPFVEGSRLFVFNTHIGPMDGPKGFRTVAVYQPTAMPTRPSLVGYIIRWMLVLPAAALAYILVVVACLGAIDDRSTNSWGVTEFTLLFAIATVAAILAGAFTAPTRHVQTASVLVVILAGTFFTLTARFAPSGIHDTSLPPTVLGQVAAGFLATLLMWWNVRRKEQQQTRRTFE